MEKELSIIADKDAQAKAEKDLSAIAQKEAKDKEAKIEEEKIAKS